jgi:hypothetical protein
MADDYQLTFEQQHNAGYTYMFYYNGQLAVAGGNHQAVYALYY